MRQRADPQPPVAIRMHRGDQRLRARVTRKIETLRGASRRVEHDQPFARAGPDAPIGGFMDPEHVVEAARAIDQLGQREVLEAFARGGRSIDAAANRADPQVPGQSTMHRIHPVVRQARGVAVGMEEAREAATIRLEPIEPALRAHPDPACSVLGHAVDTRIAERPRIGRIVVELGELARARVAPVQATGIRGNPERAVTRLVQRANVEVTDTAGAVRIGQECRRLVAVITEQSLARADPQQAVPVDEHRDCDIGIETTSRAELGEAARSAGVLPEQQQRQACDSPARGTPYEADAILVRDKSVSSARG